MTLDEALARTLGGRLLALRDALAELGRALLGAVFRHMGFPNSRFP